MTMRTALLVSIIGIFSGLCIGFALGLVLSGFMLAESMATLLGALIFTQFCLVCLLMMVALAAIPSIRQAD
jgi:hypothetical protein